jgi:collagen type VII alpha
MTTFTITCPPTVAAKTTSENFLRTESYSEFLEISGAIDDGTGTVSSTFSRSQITDSASNVYSTQFDVRYESRFGIPAGDDLGATRFANGGTTNSFSGEATFSWNGARTVANTVSNSITDDDEDYGGVASQGQTVWTAEETTSSQTTTTQTATVYQTSFTDTTNVTTRTGTLVQTGTMTELEPRTTATQTQGFTTRTSALSTTRVTTTTQQDTFNRWRTGEGGGTHRGTFQSATVVVLETSNLGPLRPEIAWIVTSRPDLTLTSSSVVEEQTLTQFTVFPSFQTAAGHVEQGAYLDDAVGFTFSTSSEEIETPTTYTTTTFSATTISVANSFTEIPTPLNEQIGTTRTTQEWFSTMREPRYTGGDISTTTSFSETTHQGRIGAVTWNATHRQSATLLSSFTFETAYTRTSSGEFGLDEDNVRTEVATGQSGYSETKTITFERPITIAASIDAPFISQNQCGSSLSFAVAAASNVSEAAQSLAAGGVSVRSPRLVAAARTARAPLGTWSYVTADTSVTASAGPSGLSATSASGPTGSIVTESTEGAWQLSGTGISRANLLSGQRINLGGTPPTGTATAFYNAGVFSTTDTAGSGTIEVTEARTDSIDTSAQRTAYVPATGVFISAGAQRYSTTRRNLTALIQETAIITNRDQLVL